MKKIFSKKYKLLLILLLTVAALNAQDNIDRHTFLGVDVNLTRKKTNGVYIKGVYKGYADKIGLKIGDTIKIINSIPIYDYDDLVTTLDMYKPGDKVNITFVRNNSWQKTIATLSSYPDFLVYMQQRFEWMDDSKPSAEIRKATLGINVIPVWDKYAVQVKSFSNNSMAQEGGLRIGDLILKMDNYEFATILELNYFLSKYNPGDTVTLYTLRDGINKTIQVKLGTEVFHKNYNMEEKGRKNK